MNRREFLRITATSTGGLLLIPNFLSATAPKLQEQNTSEQILVFVQLNGGNDGLNTFIPYTDPVYYECRPKIGIAKQNIINSSNGMGFHPALKDLAAISQEGNLCIIQNVGYPHPNRSHFRSQEIWQTASDSHDYLNYGWLGRFLEIQCQEEHLAAVNVDAIDNLALKSPQMNSITIKDFNQIVNAYSTHADYTLSENPQLNFVRKLAYASMEGREEIQLALAQSESQPELYNQDPFSKNLAWIARLIKGNLNSRIYYTSLNGFDTHNNQTTLHHKQLSILNDGLYSFYRDLKASQLLSRVTIVVFSEFGRRVRENGTGTDHGTAGPMMIIGGNNSGKIIGKNPDLINLDNGDLRYDIDFRSVYATLLKHKFQFDPQQINIAQQSIKGIF